MGIDILYPSINEVQPTSQSKLTLDIIALHGLNGSQTKTWTSPKTQKLWLRDFLPADMPKARIMTFGYDATAAFTSSTAGIVEHARDLLICLMEKRVDSEEMRRPLIFVGHSLGGLVIKQALIIAEEEARYKRIYTSTNGIVFFGTPHQGSSFATLASTILRVPSLLALNPGSELLESLKEGCPRLVELTQKFKIHHEARPYEIVSFYETRRLTGMKNLIVTKESALLTPPGDVPVFEEQIPVSADHREMCRFSSSKDKTYTSAVRCIKRIHREAMAADVKNEFFLVNRKLNPLFTGRDDILERLRGSLVEDRCIGPRYQERFVLYGLGGSGKTQMCLKFAQDHQKSFWGVFWVDATSQETAAASFRKIGGATEQGEDIESVKSWLTRKSHWLLILDNADDPELDVSKFFPEGIQGTVLITTRNPDLQKWGTAGCRVDEMLPEDAVALLLKSAALPVVLNNMQNPAAEEVVKTLGYFALAIIQAGAVIRQGRCGLDGFCETYSTFKGKLLESGGRQPGDEYQYSIYTTWEISLSKIKENTSPEANLALELLRLFAFMHFDQIQGDIFRQARVNFDNDSYPDEPILANSLFVNLMPNGWDEALMTKALDVLVRFSLISVDGSCISMHPLVHEWSRERLSQEDKVQTSDVVIAILGRSTNFAETTLEQQHSKMLLPHIDSCLVNLPGDLFPRESDHMERLRAVLKFASIYRATHRWEKAMDLWWRIVKVQQKYGHPDERQTYTFTKIVECMGYLNREQEGNELQKTVFTDSTRINDPQYDLGRKLVEVKSHLFSSRFQQAIETSTQAIDEFQPILGNDHNGILYLVELIAVSYRSLGNYRKAVRYVERIVESNRRKYGESHEHTLRVSNGLAEDYTVLKRFKQAKKLRTQAVTILQETLGSDHVLTLKAAFDLADLPRRQNIPSYFRRVRAQRDALDRCREVLGDTHPYTLKCLEIVSEEYLGQGHLSKCKNLHEDLVKKCFEQFGRNDERSIRAVETLKMINMGVATRDFLYWWLPKKYLH